MTSPEIRQRMRECLDKMKSVLDDGKVALSPELKIKVSGICVVGFGLLLIADAISEKKAERLNE